MTMYSDPKKSNHPTYVERVPTLSDGEYKKYCKNVAMKMSNHFKKGHEIRCYNKLKL